MNRRDFIAGAATGLAAGAGGAYLLARESRKDAAVAAPAVVRERHVWRMATAWPDRFPGLGTGAERLAQRITDMSEGRLSVRVLPAGTIPPLQVFDAVSQGTVEMGHAAAYYWQGKSRAFNFFTGVPFGFTASEHSAWMHEGGGQALYDEGYARFGLKPFLAGNTGAQMGGWFRREVTSLDDFRGLKIRMPGLGGEVLRRAGAVAENLPGADLYPALSSGRIDAAEWVGPWNDLAFGFHKIAKFYYWPGFHEPGSAVEAFVNKARFDALPGDLQAIVASACRAETDAMLAEFNRRNAEALGVLVGQHEVQLRRFPDEVLAALAKASEQMLRELEDADDLTSRTYQSFRRFRDESLAWARLADRGYLDMRHRLLRDG